MEPQNNNRNNRGRRAAAALGEHLGLAVLRRPAFWIALALYLTTRVATDMWAVYFVAFALAKGRSLDQAVSLTVAAGLGNVVMKVAVCVLVDRGRLSLRPCQALTTGLGALAFLLSPWLDGFWPLMAGTLVSSVCMGLAFSLLDLFIREVLGVELLVGAYSWLELVTGLAIFALGFYPGEWLRFGPLKSTGKFFRG